MTEKKCECTLHLHLVGDGCEVCNPEQALAYAKEQIEELQALAAKMATYIQEAMKLMRDSGANEREYVVFAVLATGLDAYAEAVGDHGRKEWE